MYHTSHRWDGSDTVPEAGAQPPLNASLNKPNITGMLYCVRCHNQHGDASPPTEHLLRSTNAMDALCLDCHRSRDASNHTQGSHPVGVDYASVYAAHTSAFRRVPQNSNPSNPTAALPLFSGQILCSTCHGIHYADSNSTTFDNASSAVYGRLSSSSGSLLRTGMRGAKVPYTTGSDPLNICSDCHAGKKNHNFKNQDIQCADCHAAHVDYDPADPAGAVNVFLIRRYMNISTSHAAVRNARVLFTDTGPERPYRNGQGTGVCQGCHDIPGSVDAHASTYPDTAAYCNTCHTHESPLGSFSGGCIACHGYPPTSNAAGGPDGHAPGYIGVSESVSPHSAHATGNGYGFQCSECHNGNTHASATPTYQDVFNDTDGTIAGSNAVYNSDTRTCSAMYCHSNGIGKMASVVWQDVSIAPVNCGSCHSRAGDAVWNGSPSHKRHATGYLSNPNFTCNSCHALTASDNSTIRDRVKHVNRVREVAFNSFAGGTWDGAQCSGTYCHSNGAGSIHSPLSWSSDSLTCGGCHGTGSSNGSPNYENGSLKANSHPLHTASYGCQVCHSTTTTNGISVTNPTNHVNRTYDLAPGGSSSFTVGVQGTVSVPTRCNNISCHGGNSATWGATLSCTDCHGGAVDSDDFTGQFWANGTISRMQITGGWDTTGHGRPSGNYRSGHAAAGFSAAPSPCAYCHSSSIPHQQRSNPFRFRADTYSSAQWGRNQLCQACHSFSSEGLSVDGVQRNSTLKIASRHLGYRHDAATNNGGRFCWDCHDPHGDANDFMIHDRVAVTSDAATGAPTSLSATTVFALAVPGSMGWGDFVKAELNGICQVCHTSGTVDHFNTRNYDTSHNPGFICVTCHSHNDRGNDSAFTPRGECNSCHGYPPVRRSLAAGSVMRHNNYTSAGYEDYSGGGGSHTISSHLPPTVKATDGWGPCASCHSNGDLAPMLTHTMFTPVIPSKITIDLKDRRKEDSRRSLGSERYTGRLTDGNDNTTGSCTNVNCHFKPSKRWYSNR